MLTSGGEASIIVFVARAAPFCGRGGIGRRVRLRGVWETVWVQVPPSAPNKEKIN